MHRYEVIEKFGTKVVPVEGLRSKVVVVDSQNVALIRADMGGDDHDRVSSWLLDHVIDRVRVHLR